MVRQANREFDHPILYLCPEYLSQGDGTFISYINGTQHTDPRNIRSIRRALCKHFTLDYTALRNKWRGHCDIGIPPLMLKPGYVLIPVKTRIARCKGDPCYAYVNLYYIDSVVKRDKPDGRSTINFTNGKNLGCYNRVKTIKNKIMVAKSMDEKSQATENKDQALEEILILFNKILRQEKNM
ncbi:hypothetical protein JCM14036_23520 [Desulfotomaculum defluvii]